MRIWRDLGERGILWGEVEKVEKLSFTRRYGGIPALSAFCVSARDCPLRGEKWSGFGPDGAKIVPAKKLHYRKKMVERVPEIAMSLLSGV